MVDYDMSIHTNPSAEAWTQFFRENHPDCNVPDDVMLGWFANAMMAMHDHLHGGGPLNGDHAQYLLDQERATGGQGPAPSRRATAKDQVEGLSQTSDIFTDLMQRAKKAEAERDALRDALRRLLSSPAISDGDQADPEWGCSETYAAEINARAALNREAGT